MLSRKEINQRYYESHKDELKQKRKERAMEKKKQMMLKEMDDIDFTEKNIYLERMGGCEMNDYCEKRKRKFNLQYDIDHFHERKTGDKIEYFKKRKEGFEKYCVDMDIKFRIEKYRLFRNSYMNLMGKEPNLTSMVINETFLPEEVNPNSEKYDENLLSYLEKKEGDKEVKIKHVSEISDDEE